MATPTYTTLATVTASGSSPTITFSSISQAYSDLVVSFTGFAASANYANMKFNNDSTSANYRRSEVYANSGTSGTYVTNDAVIQAYGNSGTDPRFGKIDIFDYSSASGVKSYNYQQSIINSNSLIGQGYWTGSSPITTITLTTQDGSNFSAGGRFMLHGIKVA
jgi:hypothetical protein